jgi:hypothetical protein
LFLWHDILNCQLNMTLRGVNTEIPVLRRSNWHPEGWEIG